MNVQRRSQAHNTKCIVLLRADVTVTGEWCCVTVQVAHCASCEKRCYITVSTVDFEHSIKQCMEYIIAFYQNVRYENDNF